MGKISWVTADWDNGPLQDTTMPQFQSCMGVRDGIGQSLITAEIPARFPGTLQNLSIFMGLNQFDCRWALHVDGSDSALTIEGTSPATGYLQSFDTPVHLDGTELIAFRASVVSGAGFDRFDTVQMDFKPDGDETIAWWVAQTRFGAVFQNDSDVEFFNGMGELAEGSDSASGASPTRVAVREPGRIETGFVNASVNTRTIDSVVSNRINGSVGSIAITVTAGMTGHFEDTVNSDALVSGDEINWQNENFGGGGSWTANTVASFIARSSECWEAFPFQVSGHQQNAVSTADNPLGGTWKGTSAGDTFAPKSLSKQVFRRNEQRLATNTLDTDGLAWLMVNDLGPGDSPSTLILTAGMTGNFQNFNQTVIDVLDRVRVRNQYVGTGGASRNIFQCLEQPQAIASAGDVFWDMPVTVVQGGR